MRNPVIFISYNPRNHDEETLAIRLHTIGAVNGFNMLLPDRYHSTTVIDDETKRRSLDYWCAIVGVWTKSAFPKVGF